MNLRESFASTHHANLGWNPDHERAIDKVAAAGLCDELGVLLWKAKYMSESWAYKKARTILLNTHSERFKNEARAIVDAVVDQCLHEYLSDMCQWCKGAKEVMAGDRRVICDGCQGHGIRRYTDNERARSMKLALGRVRVIQRQFRFLTELIGTQDGAVNKQLSFYLERVS